MEGSLDLYLMDRAIWVEYLDLYRKDRVFLSDKGNNILLSDLWQEVHSALGLLRPKQRLGPGSGRVAWT